MMIFLLVNVGCTNYSDDARSAYQHGKSEGFRLGLEDGYYRGYDDAQMGTFGRAFQAGYPVYGTAYRPYQSSYMRTNPGLTLNFGNTNRVYSNTYTKTSTTSKTNKGTQSKTHGFNSAKKGETKVNTTKPKQITSKTHGFPNKGTITKKPDLKKNLTTNKSNVFAKKPSTTKSKSSGFKLSSSSSKSRSSSKRR